MAADYGTPSANYTADKNIYSGMVGKIAKQLITGQGIESEFGSLFKEPMRNGKDLEVAVYLAATGVPYSATDAPVAPFPSSEVLIFKNNTKTTYAVKLDDNQIAESTTSTENATKAAAEIVQTLYAGAFKDENEAILGLLSNADATEQKKQIVLMQGVSTEPTDEVSAKTLLTDIKNVAKQIRRGAAEVNPKGLKVRAPRVVLFIPTTTETGIDVYARLGNMNESTFARYGVDEVFEYLVPAGKTADIYIADDRYFQISKVHEDSYKEQPVAGCDNVNAYLHRYIQYAGCPLFSCVKMTA